MTTRSEAKEAWEKWVDRREKDTTYRRDTSTGCPIDEFCFIEGYLAAHPAAAADAGRAVTGWRPIETCPKIGDVMLWFPRGGYRMELPPMCRVGNPVNYGYRKPTHWQPLPPPPPAAGPAKG